MNDKLIEDVCDKKIIVIVRGVEREKLIPLAQAMYNAGIRFIELAYCANGSITDEQNADNIKMLSDHFGQKMYIGAGTVLTEKQVKLTQKAGGRFVISPNTDPKVIRRTKALGLLSISGAFTPSEIQTAHQNGADFVKLYPVTNMGVKYIEALKSPFPHIRFLAVGGINESNISDYNRAGVCGFGIGSNIVPKDLVANGKFDAVAELAEKYVSAVKL